MVPLFLRRALAPDEVLGPLTPDQILENLPSGDDCLSLRANDPFVPVDRDLDRNDALRDVLLHAFPWDRAARYQRIRFALFAGLVPVVLLTVLDASLLQHGREGAAAALSVDLLSAALVAIDLARPAPRHPHVTAAVFIVTGLRFAQVISLECGVSNPLIPVFAGIGLAAGAVCLATAPGPRAVADHLRGALAMPPPTRLPLRSSPGFFRAIVYTIAAATALPLLLWVLRAYKTTLAVQLVAFMAFASVVPYVGRRYVTAPNPRWTASWLAVLRHPLLLGHPTPRALAAASVRVLAVALASLVFSFALVRGAQATVETSVRVQQCVLGEDAPRPALRRFLDAQRSEVSASRAGKVPSWLLLTVVMVPIAEELVYRGLVQHTLRKRLERHLAIGLAALLFGLAHLVVYRNAIYQPVLLGLTFGLAYERAGIVASIVVHMLWNLWLSI